MNELTELDEIIGQIVVTNNLEKEKGLREAAFKKGFNAGKKVAYYAKKNADDAWEESNVK